MNQYSVFVKASLPIIKVRALNDVMAVVIAREFMRKLDLIPANERFGKSVDAVDVTGDDWSGVTYLTVEQANDYIEWPEEHGREPWSLTDPRGPG